MKRQRPEGRRAEGRRGRLIDIIRYYTREAGVRNLEREIAKICRKAVKQLLLNKKDQKTVTVTSPKTRQVPRRAALPLRQGRGENQVGQVTGLAWTEVGGELLTIEAATVPGKGKLSTPASSAR
jgi:ATP-dependent Lon protease